VRGCILIIGRFRDKNLVFRWTLFFCKCLSLRSWWLYILLPWGPSFLFPFPPRVFSEASTELRGFSLSIPC
jgi:hypothetical protein